jgi:signal transduction histidine kinase
MESEDERENLLEALIDETIPETIDFDDYLEDILDRFCEMTDEEKQELISKYYKTEDHVDKMNQ